MKVATAEQRRHKRKPGHAPQGLKIYCYGRAVPAMIVDVSESGIGVEMLVPLSDGSVVNLEGDLENPDFSVRLEGTARVAHCLARADGRYRVGLAFEEIAYRTFR